MTPTPPRRIPCTVLLCALSTLAGCAVGPDYQRPAVAAPAQYKELSAWKVAEPSDEAPRGNWWEIYGDAQLNALVAQVEVANQNVAAAAAQYRQARAVVAAARAAWFPVIATDFTLSRGQGTVGTSATAASNAVIVGAPIRNTARLSLDASWEADVWGRIGRGVESDTAAAQASAADLQAALLSAQAALVQAYIELRINDAQQRLLDETVVAYQRSLQITRHRYAAGVAARLDVAQAETQLKATEAQAIDLGVQRGQLEHAIALLMGRAPADFALPPTDTLPLLPQIPVGLPSALLERRPDVAAAERRAAAANAQIGVAQAAFFPALTFSASGGYQTSSLSQLLTLPNRFWSLGPALALTLFDAGARSARKEQAMAAYDQSVAGYRQAVLTAFQDVEDNLVALRILAEEAVVQREAAQFAAESLRLTDNQYRSGTVSYLNVVITQAAALATQRNSLDITGRRLLASAALQKALGGDWRAAETTEQETSLMASHRIREGL
ncbi:efflux transporter outer membrane subunit [Candidatus Accumulibacter aalborgensis]|nr:efflux transporter outer membrane subunit [Candidatus Accumulibacter aalborgensis]